MNEFVEIPLDHFIAMVWVAGYFAALLSPLIPVAEDEDTTKS